MDGVGLVAEGAMAPYLELEEQDIREITSRWTAPTVIIDIAPWCGFGVQAADKYRRAYCDSTSQWTSWQRNEERRTAKRCVAMRTVHTGSLEEVFDAGMERRCESYFAWAAIDENERQMFREVCSGYRAMNLSMRNPQGRLLSESLLVHVDRMKEWYLVFTNWLRDDADARQMMLGVRALFECARVVCDDMGSRLSLGPAMTYKSAVTTSAEPALGIVLCNDDTEKEWTDYVPMERWNRCR